MYRNFGDMGHGGSSTYPNSDSGSPHTGSSAVSQDTSTSTTQQHQKFTVAGGSQFIPSLNDITSNQDLQWLVQPSLIGPAGPSRPPRPPYPPVAGMRSFNPSPSQPHLYRPGVIRAAASSGSTTRRRNDEHLSPEELARRRIRRERNKQAAAKCRNRRRELTDTLQSETDELEVKKSHLQKEIAQLQKEKEKLELVIEAHRPICKIQDSDFDSDPSSGLPSLGIKIEPEDLPQSSVKSQSKIKKPKPQIIIPARPVTSFPVPIESESLHTPILISTPSLTPFMASLVFSYPSGSLDSSSTSSSQALPPLPSSSQQDVAQQSRNPQPCSIAHRRSSSSGDQSDHSLNSPTIFTL
uniref:fos-related antigen 1-like isoform X1 n=1 Tax=Oncorhynchus gorbuscha TaxID=8017 RepID=UPI001EAE9530|nr:fos-related antigen 1-like isoform X1 [Oncorhynchus gorbuscha]XP_046151404.1 fos-related antigen 1-like isoform X1 [Oncorhynchus gorbuscha]XP_046151405.1 fos-related antigen 1-like isoform X1 [Oncorhynchus gorbuscha]